MNFFQLPLSGSHHTLDSLTDFNDVDRLSTPSLGITRIDRKGAPSRKSFQLPLSGSRECPGGTGPALRSTDFQLPLSGSL